MKNDADSYKKMLNMIPHPEGGWYSVFYESKDEVRTLNPRYGQGVVYRPAGSSIYYLLKGKEYSVFHEVNSPEIWHYYTGNTAVKLFILEKDGSLTTCLVGNPSQTKDASFQVLIEANRVFAAELCHQENDSFALVGCTVSPGFTFQDFKLNKREELLSIYPEQEAIISRLSVK